MKEDKLGISKTDGEIFMMLDEKQAGELIKALCAYQFNNETSENDMSNGSVRGLFLLMREERDKSKDRAAKCRKYMAQYMEEHRDTQQPDCSEKQKTGKFRIRRK